MKTTVKLISCLLILAISILSLSACGGNNTTNDAPYEDWVNVSNDFTTEYSLFVPNKWTVNTSAGYISLYIRAGEDKSNFSIQSTDLLISDIKTAEAFWNDYKKTLTNSLGVANEDIDVDLTYRLNGISAVKVEYTMLIDQIGQSEPEKVHIMQIFCVYNHVAYYMTYTAENANIYTSHKDEVSMVLKEFKFKNNTATTVGSTTVESTTTTTESTTAA